MKIDTVKFLLQNHTVSFLTTSKNVKFVVDVAEHVTFHMLMFQQSAFPFLGRQ